jgi:hypothetical protein
MRPGLLLGTALAAPVVAICAAPAAAQDVRVEIVASGSAEAVASGVRANGSFYERAESQAEANAKRDAKFAEIARVVAGLGVPASAVKRQEAPVTAVMIPAPPAPPAPPPPPRPAAAVGERAIVAVPIAPVPSRPAPPAPRSFGASGSISIEAGSVEQFQALRRTLSEIGVSVSNEQVTLANELETQRAAKIKALANARADAEAYARALGLRVIGVASISEAGKLIPPGLAREIERSIPSGRGRAGYTSNADATRVTATIVVEFTLAK